MTIEEKAGQLFQTVGAMYDDEAVISGPMQEMGITEKDIQLAGGGKDKEDSKKIYGSSSTPYSTCIYVGYY